MDACDSAGPEQGAALVVLTACPQVGTPAACAADLSQLSYRLAGSSTADKQQRQNGDNHN